MKKAFLIILMAVIGSVANAQSASPGLSKGERQIAEKKAPSPLDKAGDEAKQPVVIVTLTMTLRQCDALLGAANAGYGAYLSTTDIKLKDVQQSQTWFYDFLQQMVKIRNKQLNPPKK